MSPPGGYAAYLSRAATARPAQVALNFEDQHWTYAALDAAVERAADRLANAGITPGMHVALLVDNRPEYLIAQFALARLGAVFVTPNPHWTMPEVIDALDRTDTRAAVYIDRFADLAAGLHHSVSADGLFDAAPPRGASRTREPAARLYVPFSSGTTGVPKGVLHTQSSLCGAVEQLGRHLRLTSQDHILMALPLCHIFGATMSAAALSAGAAITLSRRFDLDDALWRVAHAGITVWPLAGAVAHRIAERDDLDHKDFATLRFFMWGGSAVPAALAERITARTGVRFLCSYGMTEAMMVAFNPVERPDEWHLDSPGYATDGTELRIPASGELEVRGPSVAAGYIGIAAPDFLADRWFRTGDLATIDDDGRLRIVDRVKDMLKVSGFQVAPTEVELALLSHPDVEDAAVVGRADERTGEMVVAFIVPRDPALSAAAVMDHLTVRLATYKRPRVVHFVDELPRTPGGKVRRSELRRRDAEMVQPSSS